MRKISEDPRSRPFLSSLFDSQSYIRTVVKEGRSEETFASIVACIEDINVEIKSYISQHKEDLMSGMQDVATLAERYNNLSSNAEKLQKSIVKLKKEAIESHSLVSTRTVELERIHETSILLQQLKNFARANAQLDLYLASSGDKDIRTLSSTAKTLNELEKLLVNPKLMDIKFVNDSSTNIKLFSKNIRLLAQDRLLTSITDKNQASIASSLQVFYNLQCLPEIVMMVIDISVKKTADLSREALDFEALVSLQPELGVAAQSNVGMSAISSTKKTLPLSVNNSSASASVTAPASAIISSPQLLMAMREMGHLWSTIIHDNAMQMHSFQRVVAKKEDPTTHEKFLDVLKRIDKQSAANNASGNAPQNVAQSTLSNGQLLELFWHRLSSALNDVAVEKVRAHPIAASRAYPYLRKAAVDLLENLKALTERDMIRDFHSGSSTGSNFLPTKDFTESLCADLGAAGTSSIAGKRRDTGYMFGSLQWSQNDLLSTLDMGSLSRVSARNHYNRANISNAYKERFDTTSHSGIRRGQQHATGGPNDSAVSGLEHNLVVGLKPIKDRFLLLSLARMTAPIMQMFPEVEGYTAAIPSKRDLQTLTKALQAELVTAVLESDIGLVAASCKEFTKATQLMLSKIEGMVINSPETRKISSQNSFSRTSQQEHNGQLFVLLMQFKDALEKIPAQVLKVVEETTGGALVATSTNTVTSALSADPVTAEMKKAVQRAVDSIDDLAERQITDAIVALLAGYTQSIIIGLHKEGVSNFTGPKPTTPAAGDSSVDCSVAVQTLTKQVPAMLKSHLISSLPKCSIVDAAVEEVCLRMMHSYVTVAALCRPMSEALRLRTAKDMSSLDMLISSLITIPNAHLCPVSQEFKSYRRLLFMESEQKNASSSAAGTSVHAPNRSQLIQLPYINQLRPSTLLGYLISCAPSQLPSPHDVENRTLTSYIQDLSEVSGVELKSFPRDGGEDLKVHARLAHSIRSLYRSASAASANAWVKAESESKAWSVVQQSEDIFFQRITVADGAQKVLMRSWHDVIQDMGVFYFGGR